MHGADRRLSDESEITSVYAAGEEDVDIAVKAARKALKDPSWKLLPATDRGNLMLKLADLIDQHKETLATIETWDNGGQHMTSLPCHTVPSNVCRQALFCFPGR